MQAAHAWHPFAVTWDNHEVHNDYAAEQSEDPMPVEAFLRRRAAAYQAHYEHMPLRPTARPIGPEMTLYDTLTFGDLASFMMLDNRQYRSDQACQGPEEFGGQVNRELRRARQEDRPMLGPEQERWLRGQLAGTTARWKVIGQQMLMAQLEQKQGEGEAWWSDGWDGYPGRAGASCPRSRSRRSGRGGDRRRHPLVLGHRSQAGLQRSGIADGGHRFVGTSVTSEGVPYDVFCRFLPENPHIRFFESRDAAMSWPRRRGPLAH